MSQVRSCRFEPLEATLVLLILSMLYNDDSYARWPHENISTTMTSPACNVGVVSLALCNEHICASHVTFCSPVQR